MNYDLALIAAILEGRSMTEAIKEGATAEMLGDEAQIYWDVLYDHKQRFNEIPSIDYFLGLCPNYDHNPSEDGVPAIVHELKTRSLENKIEEGVRNIIEQVAVDPWLAKKRFVDLATEIATAHQEGNTDLIAGTNKREVMTDLETLQQCRGLIGYPFPWDILNESSTGLSDGNLVYLYGREKSKKTFLLIFMACFWEMLGLRILYLTREMTRKEIAWRVYAMRGGYDYGALLRGEISEDGVIGLEQVLDDLAHHSNFIISEVEGGLAGMRAKIEEIKPHIVIHDAAAYLAMDETIGTRMREHDAVGKVANGLKMMAMQMSLPIIACGHANREGEKLKGKSSIEYAGSDKWARRVDYGGRVISDDVTNRIAIIFNAGRNLQKFFSFTVSGNLCHGFGEFMTADTTWVDGEEEVAKESKESKERNDVKEKKLDSKTWKPPFRR